MEDVAISQLAEIGRRRSARGTWRFLEKGPHKQRSNRCAGPTPRRRATFAGATRGAGARLPSGHHERPAGTVAGTNLTTRPPSFEGARSSSPDDARGIVFSSAAPFLARARLVVRPLTLPPRRRRGARWRTSCTRSVRRARWRWSASCARRWRRRRRPPAQMRTRTPSNDGDARTETPAAPPDSARFSGSSPCWRETSRRTRTRTAGKAACWVSPRSSSGSARTPAGSWNAARRRARRSAPPCPRSWQRSATPSRACGTTRARRCTTCSRPRERGCCCCRSARTTKDRTRRETAKPTRTRSTPGPSHSRRCARCSTRRATSPRTRTRTCRTPRTCWTVSARTSSPRRFTTRTTPRTTIPKRFAEVQARC